MIDSNTKGAVELASLTGLSKDKCYRLMKGDKTVRLVDVEIVALALGLEIKFVKVAAHE